ncbi:MAG: acyl transferase [Bacteroidetes bacterium]|nr:acyl transferase [Bacteroidota bacterium]
MHDLSEEIFSVTEKNFDELALRIFRFQYQNNQLYKYFVDELKMDIGKISTITGIPFMPIAFFKNHRVKTTAFDPELVFESSGTTKTVSSKHFIKNSALYKQSFIKGFEKFYGPVSNWCIIGLLPSYLERQHSSLVMMVSELIRLTGNQRSGFYLYDHEKLSHVLRRLEEQGQPVLLIGVTFALLDFAERYPMQLLHTIVMETGGMKGRREEITRVEAHAYLKMRLGVAAVHSEYGMTELLSQAYAKAEGLFESVPWMKVLIRNEDDPLFVEGKGAGILNVIDLANIYSCSFIATDDVGVVHNNGHFEVTGRVDNSDIRGCSLLVR